MKKKTVKQQLVEHMLSNGNSFTYTEMIKALLKVQHGPNFEYDWRLHRGYYATNFNTTYGYMVNGGGDCGVYKDPETGKWKAKIYTKDERFAHRVKGLIRDYRSFMWNSLRSDFFIPDLDRRVQRKTEQDIVRLAKKVYTEL